MTLELDLKYGKITSHAKFQLLKYVKACKRKVQKTVYFQYSEFKKGHNSHKNWCKLTTLELDLYYSKTKSYAKF